MSGTKRPKAPKRKADAEPVMEHKEDDKEDDKTDDKKEVKLTSAANMDFLAGFCKEVDGNITPTNRIFLQSSLTEGFINDEDDIPKTLSRIQLMKMIGFGCFLDLSDIFIQTDNLQLCIELVRPVMEMDIPGTMQRLRESDEVVGPIGKKMTLLEDESARRQQTTMPRK